MGYFVRGSGLLGPIIVSATVVDYHWKAISDLLLVSFIVNDKSTLFTRGGDPFREVSLPMTQSFMGQGDLTT